MEKEKALRKVINLPSRNKKDKSVENKYSGSYTRVISITSGKGGVGKTNIVANLGYALGQLGKKVLILDADLGLANLDVILGITPKYNFAHVIEGEKSIREITVKGPGNIEILPASSGIQELTNLSIEQGIRFLSELDSLLNSFDIFLIDTAAGISSNVMYFNATAQEIIVVVSPEPTSITDAYALMKVLSLKYSIRDFKLVVNMVGNDDEAYEVFRQLSLVADRFLDISIEYLGFVLHDKNISKSVRYQKLVSELFPDCYASKCFNSLAKKILSLKANNIPRGHTNFNWRHLLIKNSDW
ncbi:Site-determining protein [uncultured Desulfobacterium sp.]|uniref:Site-determining protein n=1 Tax=uncultured Desulfobacterium sp. TaxID=201089 RepID=A0A445MTE8_9BACT|nr:Site-determining protein [uncultured Desulfobacterium sp.]